jgi:hypothetical protein
VTRWDHTDGDSVDLLDVGHADGRLSSLSAVRWSAGLRHQPIVWLIGWVTVMVGAALTVVGVYLPQFTFAQGDLVRQIDGRGHLSVHSGIGLTVARSGLAVGWASFWLGIALLVATVCAVAPIREGRQRAVLVSTTRIAISVLAADVAGAFGCEIVLTRWYASNSKVDLLPGWWLLGAAALFVVVGAVVISCVTPRPIDESFDGTPEIDEAGSRPSR